MHTGARAAKSGKAVQLALRGPGRPAYVKTAPDFLRANPGFAHDFQFIDVPDYQGQGESAPVPHFYQVRPCRHYDRWDLSVK